MKKQLIDAFKRAAQFASRDDSRPALCGVRYADGKLIATDGHRLIVIDLGCAPWPFKFTMPAAVVGMLDDASTVTADGTLWGTGTGEPHIEGFPDWTRVVPEAVPNGELVPSVGMQGLQPVCVVELDWQTFAGIEVAAKAATTWGKVTRQHAKVKGVKLPTCKKDWTLKIDPAKGWAALSVLEVVPDNVAFNEWLATRTADEAVPLVPCDSPRPDDPSAWYCGVNPKYLKAALDNASKPARCQFAGEFEPIRIDRDDGETHIVMPMRL